MAVPRNASSSTRSRALTGSPQLRGQVLQAIKLYYYDVSVAVMPLCQCFRLALTAS
jgi:hypothetical protein